MTGLLSGGGAAALALAGAWASVLCVFAFLAFRSLGGDRRRLRRRLNRVCSQFAAEPAVAAPPPAVRRNVADSSIEGLDKLIKRVLPRPAKLRERLAATGSRISLGEYTLASALVGALVFLVVYELDTPLVATALFSAGAALGLPHLAIAFMIRRRRARFVMQFPEAIDLIARGLRSGLPVTESMKVVGAEVPDPVGVEFRQIIQSFAFGLTLNEALAATAGRIDVPEFRFFVTSVSIQQETGGNLTETLENLSNILRRRKQMKLKIRAVSSEARASAMIVGALPFVIFAALLVIRPSYMMVLIEQPLGHLFLGAGLLSMGVGIFTMYRMAKFDI